MCKGWRVLLDKPLAGPSTCSQPPILRMGGEIHITAVRCREGFEPPPPCMQPTSRSVQPQAAGTVAKGRGEHGR